MQPQVEIIIIIIDIHCAYYRCFSWAYCDCITNVYDSLANTAFWNKGTANLIISAKSTAAAGVCPTYSLNDDLLAMMMEFWRGKNVFCIVCWVVQHVCFVLGNLHICVETCRRNSIEIKLSTSSGLPIFLHSSWIAMKRFTIIPIHPAICEEVEDMPNKWDGDDMVTCVTSVPFGLVSHPPLICCRFLLEFRTENECPFVHLLAGRKRKPFVEDIRRRADTATTHHHNTRAVNYYMHWIWAC